jgi:very-short-patch-repair endonuclease
MRVESTCPFCHSSFSHEASARRKYCSKTCHDQSRLKFVNCRTCGTRYHKDANRGPLYCSRGCAAIGRRTKVERPCEQCHQLFLPFSKDQKYCSQKCNSVIQQQRRRESGYYPKQVALKCKQCSVEFHVAPSHAFNSTLNKPKRFCSKACKLAASRKKWPLERTNLILYTCQECNKEWYDKPSLKHRKKFCSQSCVGAATVRRLQTESPTGIEVETYAALSELKQSFEPQYRINRWVVDAFIADTNTIIECLGQFHHCDPRFYPDGPKYALQYKTVERDKRRKAEFLSQGYIYIELWESDIKRYGARVLLERMLSS